MCALLPVSVRPRGTQLLSQYSWRIFLGVKMQQYVAFALGDNFQTAGSAELIVLWRLWIPFQIEGGSLAMGEASIILIRPSLSLMRLNPVYPNLTSSLSNILDHKLNYFKRWPLCCLFQWWTFHTHETFIEKDILTKSILKDNII